MQLLFLFCTMLIVISEAFSQKLHAFRRLNGFNRKTSRFQHRLEYPVRQPKFSDSHIPRGRVVPTVYESQCEAPDFLLVHRYGIKPYERGEKHFSRKNGPNKRRLGRYFFRKNRGFFTESVFRQRPRSYDIDQVPRSRFRHFRTSVGLRKIRNSKLYGCKRRRRHQCLPRVYDSFSYKNPRFKQRTKLIPGKKKPKRFSNFRSQCLSDADLSVENSATKANATNVFACRKEVKTKSETFPDAKLDAESPRNFSESPKPITLTPVPTTDTTPVTFSTHKFELVDSPKLYDLSLPDTGDLVSNVRKKQEAIEIGDKSKNSLEDSLVDDISKLKRMINDLENVVREGRMKSLVRPTEENYKLNNETKVVTEKIVANLTEDDKDIKEKIDKVAIPILTQISEGIGVKNTTNVTTTTVSSNVTSGTHSKKNVRCNPDGTWMSSTMKIGLTFTMQSNMLIKVSVKSYKGSQINEKWSLQGLALSSRGGPFILAGISPQKKVASFLGQCKISKEKDFIFGIWTLFGFSQKYTDLWSSVETKLDVLTKNESSKKKSKKRDKKSKGKKKKHATTTPKTTND